MIRELTLASGIHIAETEVKRSRFIAAATQVNNESQARALIDAQRKQYPDARHHCSAYTFQVENANPVLRSNDDGEPGGTAGKPMLEVITGLKIVNVCVVVTRYFGGTLLGTGGLLRAYASATTQVLTNSPKMWRVTSKLFEASLTPQIAARAQGRLKAFGYDIVEIRWDTKATIVLSLSEQQVCQARALLSELNSSPVDLIEGSKHTVLIPVSNTEIT